MSTNRKNVAEKRSFQKFDLFVNKTETLKNNDEEFNKCFYILQSKISILLFAVAPRIDRNAMLDIKVRAGHNFELDVPVIGEPPPSKEWSLKENIVLNTDRIKVINEDYNTKLRVVDAKRSDAGVYTLLAKNINGKDTATVNVSVLGKLLVLKFLFIALKLLFSQCQ